MKVLVVAAHPDDEVLGAGGTIRRLADEGEDVVIAILGEGIAARTRPPSGDHRQAQETLRRTARDVGARLGAVEVVLHDFPDNKLDTVPLLDVIHVVERLVEQHLPDTLYTHHPGDLNIDHRRVHQAVLTATRPLPDQLVREVYAFEVPSSSEWSFCLVGPPFRPNVFVDISSTLETKIEAMAAYEGEIRPYPHPRSAEALRATAMRWGSVAGFRAAEPFQLVRALR